MDLSADIIFESSLNKKSLIIRFLLSNNLLVEDTEDPSYVNYFGTI